MNATYNAPAHKQTNASSSFIMDEVAKHSKKGEIWVTHGRVLHVSVFGREAGAACARYMSDGQVKATSSAELSGSGFLVKGDVAKSAGKSDEDMRNVSSNLKLT